MDSRRLLTVVAVVAVVGLLLVAGVVGVLVWQFLQPVPESFTHEYEYSLYVQPDAPLSNVTVYLPAPVDADGEPVDIGRVAVAEAPPGTARLVETEYGPMLAVDLDRLPAGEVAVGPANETASAPANRTTGGNETWLAPYELRVTVETNETIDTRAPDGSEPLLSPREAVRTVACGDTEARGATCRTFDTRVFLRYDAPADATVQLGVRLEGRNWWFAGGWTGNSYAESVVGEFTGPQDGWQELTGETAVGSGNYRN